MSEWGMVAIRDLIVGHWPGEWGGEPVEGPHLATVYRATEMDDDGHLSLEGGAHRSVLPRYDSKALRQGDIVLEASGGTPERPVGRPALCRAEPAARAFVSNFLRVLRPKANVDARFLGWRLLLLHRQSDILRFQQQTTGIINLKIEDYLDHEIVVPFDKAVQSAIADVLDQQDDQIAQTEALIAKQERIRAGLLQDLFTRGVDQNGALRPPREEAPDLYHQTELGWLPKGWDPVRLKAMARPGTPHIKTGPFGSALKIEHWVDHDGHPVVTIGALGVGAFVSSELLYVSSQTAERLQAYQLAAGDVVFSRVADVGRSVVIESNAEGWLMSSNLMRISVDRQQMRPHYLYLQLAFSAALKAQVRQKVNAGGREVANAQILNALLFARPDPSEQDDIIARADDIDANIRRELETLTKLRMTKAGLMQDLLTGRVSVAPLLQAHAA